MKKSIGMQWILPHSKVAPKDAWVVISSLLLAEGHATEMYLLYGNAISTRRLMKKVAKETHFQISNRYYSIRHCPVTNYGFDFISVDCSPVAKPDTEMWTANICSMGGLIQGWILDINYDYWQNAEDPLEYTTEGRSYAHLPMKSNGLPYPLEQMIIDTSQNPGRRVMRVGYVEAVGYVMWFGEPFWKITGTSKQKVISQDWLKCEERPVGILRVQAAEQPFTSAEGEQGEIQRRLRELLFPRVA